jgi:hypothetical protein
MAQSDNKDSFNGLSGKDGKEHPTRRLVGMFGAYFNDREIGQLFEGA